jgi:hypothetical protein
MSFAHIDAAPLQACAAADRTARWAAVRGSWFVAAAGVMLAFSAAALPPPPEYAELPTRLFGKVLVPHARHLAARVPCRRCHGDRPVSQMDPLGPERGHGICYRCHVERSAGPTECRDCHHGLPARKEPAPVVVTQTRTGGWRALRWCMTTADAHDALASMHAPAHREMTIVASGGRDVREFDVALEEPVARDVIATQARLAFRHDALSAIKLYLASPNEDEAYRTLLADFTATHGPPALADPPSEFWWFVSDTSLLLLPAIPEVAPVEIWLGDRAPTTCAPPSPDPGYDRFREDTRGRARRAAHAPPAAQASPTASQ